MCLCVCVYVYVCVCVCLCARADDGAHAIDIPSFLIPRKVANNLRSCMRGNAPCTTDDAVVLRMSWSLPAPDDRVEWSIWCVTVVWRFLVPSAADGVHVFPFAAAGAPPRTTTPPSSGKTLCPSWNRSGTPCNSPPTTSSTTAPCVPPSCVCGVCVASPNLQCCLFPALWCLRTAGVGMHGPRPAVCVAVHQPGPVLLP